MERVDERREAEDGPLPWGDEATPGMRTAFHRAARAFEESRPWRVASDAHVLDVHVPALGLEHACASILGGKGENFGLSLFRSLDDYVAFTRLGPAASTESPGARPGVSSVHLLHPQTLPGGLALAARARACGWQSVGSGWLPVLIKLDAEGAPQAVAESDYALATACLDAVAAFVQAERRHFREPKGETARGRREVVLPSGPVSVEVLVPPPGLPWEWGREEPSAGLRRADAQTLVEAFVAARGTGVDDEARARLLAHVQEALRFKLRRGEAAHVWTADDVQSFLLDHYPAQGSAPDEELDQVPAHVDAFLEWLAGREGADAAALQDARARLQRSREAFLRYAREPQRFSPQKVLVRAARAEGVDLADEAAVDAFVKRFKRRLARDPSLLPKADAALQRKVWVWTPGQPVPDPKGECPCGSGKRYRRCCMPR